MGCDGIPLYVCIYVLLCAFILGSLAFVLVLLLRRVPLNHIKKIKNNIAKFWIFDVVLCCFWCLLLLSHLSHRTKGFAL